MSGSPALTLTELRRSFGIDFTAARRLLESGAWKSDGTEDDGEPFFRASRRDDLRLDAINAGAIAMPKTAATT